MATAETEACIKQSGQRTLEKDFLSAALTCFTAIITPRLDHGVMIPPTCPRQIIGPAHDASGAYDRMTFAAEKHLKGSMEKDKADRAVVMVWSAIEKIRNEVPNLICISELDYSENLLEFLGKFGIKVEKIEQKAESKQQKKYAADLIVVHPDKGILIIEVKSADNEKSALGYLSRFSKKFKVLEGGLNEIFNIVKIKHALPIKGFIAFPMCTIKDKKGYILDMSDTGDINAWWQTIPNTPEEIKQSFEKVASILIALRCQLKSINNELEEVQVDVRVKRKQHNRKNPEYVKSQMVSEKIHRDTIVDSLKHQTFLEHNELFQKKELIAINCCIWCTPLTLLNGTAEIIADLRQKTSKKEKKFATNWSKLSENLKSHIIREQFLLLTPEQVAVLEGSELQIIEGPPGSGKSITLHYEAYNFVEKHEKVCIVAPNVMAAIYRGFFIDKYGEIERVKIFDYNSFYTKWDFQKESVKEQLEEYHLFFDDFFNDGTSIKPKNGVEEIFEQLVKSRNEKKGTNYHCWIACDAHQINKDNNARQEQLTVILNLMNHYNFQHQILRNVMRCASNIAELFYKQWQPINPDLHGTSIYMGNNIIGKFVLERPEPVDVKQISEHIFEVVNKLKKYDNYEAKDIAIINVSSRLDLLNEIQEKIKQKTGYYSYQLRSIEVNLPKDWDTMIKMDASFYTYSLEWPCCIIIMDEDGEEIDPNKYVAYSRAMYALIFVYIKKQT